VIIVLTYLFVLQKASTGQTICVPVPREALSLVSPPPLLLVAGLTPAPRASPSWTLLSETTPSRSTFPTSSRRGSSRATFTWTKLINPCRNKLEHCLFHANFRNQHPKRRLRHRSTNEPSTNNTHLHSRPSLSSTVQDTGHGQLTCTPLPSAFDTCVRAHTIVIPRCYLCLFATVCPPWLYHRLLLVFLCPLQFFVVYPPHQSLKRRRKHHIFALGVGCEC
jgi:hypothetical protein